VAVYQVTDSARDKAAALFKRIFNDAERLDDQSAGDLVDALVAVIEEQRARGESDHTRALAAERRFEPDPSSR